MIRYPGSKDKIVRHIMAHFPQDVAVRPLFQASELEYREPFFGAGAIGFEVLPFLGSQHAVWINDRDPGLRCLWGTVHDVPTELIERVRSFIPSVDKFYEFKSTDGLPVVDPVEAAFRKLALHQISFSGLGAKAGGPLGGRKQSSKYNVDCRWNSSRLCRDIKTRHDVLRRFRRVRITAFDFSKLIIDAPAHAFIYADPPYVSKGPELYQHSMTDADHRRLAAALRACRARWVLSYDDHPLIRELYDWARIDSISLTYTTAIATGRRRKNAEIVITKK